MHKGFLDSDRPLDRVALAADFSTEEEMKPFIGLFRKIGFVKVGLEMISSLGLEKARKLIVGNGGRVLVDLKLHDIPTTVGKTVETLARQGYFAVTIHTNCQPEMLEAAVVAAKKVEAETGHRILLIGVTRLTSERDAVSDEEMLRRAKLAASCGLSAVVCHPLDLALLQACPDTAHLLTLVPGIRLVGDDADDQVAPQAPDTATEAGADVMVIGRALTKAKDPYVAAGLIDILISKGLLAAAGT